MKVEKLTTLDQEECAYALRCVDDILGDKSAAKEYFIFAKRLPAMIVTCGLGQSLAFLFSQTKPNEKSSGKTKLWNHISKWLQEEQGIYSPGRMILYPLMEGHLSSYIHAQEMTLRLLFWIRKLLDGLLEE